jgi:hypothetical protein
MVDISEEGLASVESMLNSTISNLLWGGSSDPGWGQLSGAAACFKTLKILGLNIEKEEDRREVLSGGNIHGEDFLK